MTILFVPLTYPSEYNRVRGVFYVHHAEALANRGHQVYVLSVVLVSVKDIAKQGLGGLGFVQSFSGGIHLIQATIPSIPLLRRVNALIRQAIAAWLYRKLKERSVSFDLCHVHGSLAGDIARRIRKQDGIPYFVTEHSSGFARGLLTSSQWHQARRVFRDAVARTAVSSSLSRRLEQQFGFAFVVTPNPFVRPAGVPRQSQIRNGDGKQRGLRICCLGFANQNKRFDRLLLSFKEVLSEDRDSELLVGGDGPDLPRLKALAIDLGIRESVTFLGHVDRDQLSRFYRGCDLFALPSEYETFGIVLLEAMSFGLPVVSTKCGGPEDVVTDPTLGVLTENSDAGFSQGLRHAVSALRYGMYSAESIRKYVEANFSTQQVGEAMENIYAEVLKA